MTIIEAMENPKVFARSFRGDSWAPWLTFLRTVFALPMSQGDIERYQCHTGRIHLPTQPFREVWVATGRRAGKSLIAALVTVYMTCFRTYGEYLAAGEVAVGMTVSPDRRQSRVIGRFQRGFCRKVPSIASMIVGETKDSLEFSNSCILETKTANPATLRGDTSHIITNDEIAFLPQESSATPDEEILIAERPCLASIPGSLLLSISSPYARRGELYRAFENHYGKDDSDVLFWKASSLEMNPTLDERIIASAYERDPAIAAAEWGGDFRSDCERLFTEEMLESATDHDRPEILPPCFEEEVAP